MVLGSYIPFIWLGILTGSSAGEPGSAPSSLPNIVTPENFRCWAPRMGYPEALGSEIKTERTSALLLGQVLVDHRIDPGCTYRYVRWSALPSTMLIRNMAAAANGQNLEIVLLCDLLKSGRIDACRRDSPETLERRLDRLVREVTTSLVVEHSFVTSFQHENDGFTLRIALRRLDDLGTPAVDCIPNLCVQTQPAPPPPSPKLQHPL